MPELAFDLDDALASLGRTPAAVDALLRPLPESWIDATDGDGTWSARQVVAHLIDAERVNWIVRVRGILDADGEPSAFAPFDIAGSVAGADGQPLAALLDTFAALRAESVAWLRAAALTEADLDRTGLHPRLGAVTLRQLLATWVVHDHAHLVQLSRTLARQYRTAVGPWTAFLSVFGDR